MIDKRSSSNAIDMLNGPLFKKILLFALPLATSSLLQELFNSMDVAAVGHFVGSEVLVAVGSNAPVIGLLINLFMGISMEAVPLFPTISDNRMTGVTQCHQYRTVGSCSQWLFSAVVGIGSSRPIRRMGTPLEVLDEAVTYLRIYFLGIPFIMAFNF